MTTSIPAALIALSEETALTIEDSHGSRPCKDSLGEFEPGWRTIALGAVPRLGVAIPSGSRAVFDRVKVEAEQIGLLVFGVTRRDLSESPKEIAVSFRGSAAPADNAAPEEVTLFRGRPAAFDEHQPWTECRFSIEPAVARSGSFVVECPATGPGEVALYEFVVGPAEHMDLNRARAFRELRIRNDKASMDVYYQHPIFRRGEAPAVPGASPAVPDVEAPAGVPAAPAPPNAFFYSRSLLPGKLGVMPPDFGSRIRRKLDQAAGLEPAGHGSKLRILSLCCGTAMTESDLLRGGRADRLHLTLVDLNPGLLAQAKARLGSVCEVETVLGDVNLLDLQGEKFDVILCVAGFHHLVELERVTEEIARGLRPGGEFWSIGETVGRNGGRMWPESYEVASAFFRRLDEKHRFDPSAGRALEALPDFDYSVGCFEGIRCEAIVPTLNRFLAPIQVNRQNCIIWKLFSPPFVDNFDLAVGEDRALVEQGVDLDVELQRRGGRAVELNAIFST